MSFNRLSKDEQQRPSRLVNMSNWKGAIVILSAASIATLLFGIAFVKFGRADGEPKVGKDVAALDDTLRHANGIGSLEGDIDARTVATGGFDEDASEESHWSSWRGPLGTGESPLAKPPVRWNEDENILWKTELPGKGHSTPIVRGNQIFVTTAIPFGEKFEPIPDGAPGSHDNLMVEQRHRFALVSIERSSGAIEWTKPLHESIPHEGAHYTASLASASPTTDGQNVYVSFGSFGVYCVDYQGELVWERQLGRMNTKHGHGEGNSPLLVGDLLIVNWDHEGESFLVALEKDSGDTRWRVDRDEVTSWSSPAMAVVDGRTQVIVSGTEKVRGYDAETGDIVWECGGLSHNIVATPLVSNGIAIVGSSYEIRAMLAIRLSGAEGDVTGSEHVVWTRDRSTPYVPSPVIYDGAVYYLSHYQGVLSRVELESGNEPTGPFRIDLVRDVYASLVAADGRIYLTDRDGVTNVIQAGEIPRILARNQLDDRFSASPVMLDNELFLRGESYLYCIRDENEESED